MALVRLSNEIVSIRGRFGGVYFKTDPNGQHIQAMPHNVKYPRSTFQMAGINAWTGMSGFWMLALLTFGMALWVAYAAIHFFTTKTGEKKKITSWNWYVHYAMRFPESEGMPFWKPPHAPGDLPHFICTFRGRWMYEHTPLTWGPDCQAGYYWPGPVPWNGKPTYQTDDFEWHLWWKDPEWILSPGPGFEPEGLTSVGEGGTIKGYYRNPITTHRSHVYQGRPD